MLSHVCGNATAEELHHRRSLRGTDDEEIHAHRCGKIDNCRGGVLAYGVKRNHVDAALVPSLRIENMIAFASGSSSQLERPSRVPAAV